MPGGRSRRGSCRPASRRAPWRKLTATLGAAIDWVVASATRLDARRAQRIDRSAEYRHLAALALRADADECHRVFAAVFGLGAPRHFYGIDDDPQKAELPQIGWQAGPAAPIEASLYRPGARAAGSGHGARLIDTTARAERFAEQCVREQAELERALERFRGKGALALSDLGTLDAAEFRHLLGWLDRALLARRGRRRRRPRALRRRPLRARAAPACERGAAGADRHRLTGVLVAPDFRLEVRER